MSKSITAEYDTLKETITLKQIKKSVLIEVIVNNRLLGIISLGDIRRYVRDRQQEQKEGVKK